MIGDGDVALPCLNEISFDGKESLRQLIVQIPATMQAANGSRPNNVRACWTA